MSIRWDTRNKRWRYEFDRYIQGRRHRLSRLLPRGWSQAQADAYDRTEGARLYALARLGEILRVSVDDAGIFPLHQHEKRRIELHGIGTKYQYGGPASDGGGVVLRILPVLLLVWMCGFDGSRASHRSGSPGFSGRIGGPRGLKSLMSAPSRKPARPLRARGCARPLVPRCGTPSTRAE